MTKRGRWIWRLGERQSDGKKPEIRTRQDAGGWELCDRVRHKGVFHSVRPSCWAGGVLKAEAAKIIADKERRGANIPNILRTYRVDAP